MLNLPSEYEYKKAKLLRWYGIDREGDRKDFRCEAPIKEWGYKFHMNDINAAIGIENLKIVDDNIDKHFDNALYYNEQFEYGVTELRKLEFKPNSSYWIYSVKVPRRDDFQRAMKDRGIMTSQVHERNDIHPCVTKYKTKLDILDDIIGELSSIPVGWWVSQEDREYIVEQIKKGW